VSAVTDRLSDDDFRELARLIRGIHARAAAKAERERQAATAPPGDEHGRAARGDAGDGEHDAA
jgi:hypothetical protein